MSMSNGTKDKDDGLVRGKDIHEINRINQCACNGGAYTKKTNIKSDASSEIPILLAPMGRWLVIGFLMTFMSVWLPSAERIFSLWSNWTRLSMNLKS